MTSPRPHTPSEADIAALGARLLGLDARPKTNGSGYSQKIDPAKIRELVLYSPENGEMRWKVRGEEWFLNPKDAPRWNTRYAGKPAFALHDKRGYLVGRILGIRYKAHRVVWALFYGAWPNSDIDHINGVRDDNRIINLRIVTRSENSRNTQISSRNTSGVVGVSFCQNRQLWNAQIKYRGRQVYIGRFSRFEDAVAARKSAEARFNFHKNHGRAAPIIEPPPSAPTPRLSDRPAEKGPK